MKKQILFLSFIFGAVFLLTLSINAHAKPNHYSLYKYYYGLAKSAIKGNGKDLSIIKRNAISGNSFAQAELGFYYYSKSNGQKALFWTKKSVRQGNYAAENNLGALYLRGLFGLNQNYRKGLYWLKKSAMHGYDYAEYALGFAYFQGKGFPVRYNHARYWLKKASQNGFKLADVNLFLIYLKGLGVPKNYKKAFYYGKKSGIYRLCFASATLYIMTKYSILKSAAKPKAAYECRELKNKGGR
jgi:TPR repeat protein